MKRRILSTALALSMIASFVPQVTITQAEEASSVERTYAEYASMSLAPEIPLLPSEISSEMSYYDFVETYAHNDLLPQNAGDSTAYTLSANPVFQFWTSGSVDAPTGINHTYVRSSVLPDVPTVYDYNSTAEYLAAYTTYCATYKFYACSGYKNTYFFTTSSYDGNPFIMNEQNGFGYDNNYNVGAYSYKSLSSVPKFDAIFASNDIEAAHLGSSSGYINYVELEGSSNDTYYWADYNNKIYGNDMFWLINSPYHYWQSDYRLAFRDNSAPDGNFATYFYSDGTDGLVEGHYVQILLSESVRMSVLDSTYNWDDSFQISCTAVDMADESTIEEKLIGTSVLVDGSYFTAGETDGDGTNLRTILTFKLDADYLEEHQDIRITRVQSVDKQSPLQLFSVQAYTQKWGIMDVTNVETDAANGIYPVYASYPITDLAGNSLSIDIWTSSQSYNYTIMTEYANSPGYYYGKSYNCRFATLDVDSLAPQIVSMDIALSADDAAAWPVTSENEWPANISRTLLFRSDESTRNYQLTYYIDFDEAIDTTDDIYKNAYITGIYDGDEEKKYYATGVANDNTRLIFDIGSIPTDAVSANDLFYPTAFYPNGGIYDVITRSYLDNFTTAPTGAVDYSITERKTEMTETVDLTSIDKERNIYLDTKAPTIELDDLHMYNDYHDDYSADYFPVYVEVSDADGTNTVSSVDGTMASFKINSDNSSATFEYYVGNAATSQKVADSDFTSGRTGVSYSFPIQGDVQQVIYIKGLESGSSVGSYMTMDITATDWALNSTTVTSRELNIDKAQPTISTSYFGYGGSYYFTYVTITEDHSKWDKTFQYQWVKGTLENTEIDEDAWITATYPYNNYYVSSANYSTQLPATEYASLYIRVTDPYGNVTNYEAECLASEAAQNRFEYTADLDEVQYDPSFSVSTPFTPSSTVVAYNQNAATVITVKYTDASGNIVYKAAELDNKDGTFSTYDLFLAELTWYEVTRHAFVGYASGASAANTLYVTLAEGASADGVKSRGFTTDSLYSNVEIQLVTAAYKSTYDYDMFNTVSTSDINSLSDTETFTMKVSNSDSTKSSDVFGDISFSANVDFLAASSGNSRHYYAASDLSGIVLDFTIEPESTYAFQTGWESEIDLGRSEFVIAKMNSNSSPALYGATDSTVVYSENLTEASATQTFVIPDNLNLEDGVYEVYIKLTRTFANYNSIDYVTGSTLDGDFCYYFIVENSGTPSYGLYGISAITSNDVLDYEIFGSTTIITGDEEETILTPLTDITLNLAPSNMESSAFAITKSLRIGYETKNAATYFASSTTATGAVNFGTIAGLRVWNKGQVEDGSDIYLQEKSYAADYGDDLSAYTFTLSAYNPAESSTTEEFGLVDSLSGDALLEKVQTETYLPFVEGENIICVQLQMSDGTFTPTQEYTINVVTTTPEISVTETPVGLTEYNGAYYMSGLDVSLDYAISGVGGATVYAFESSIALDDVNNIPTVTGSMDGTAFQDGRWSSGKYTAGNQISIVAMDENGGYTWYMTDTDNYTYEGSSVTLASLESMLASNNSTMHITDAEVASTLSLEFRGFENLITGSNTPFLKSLSFINNNNGSITALYSGGEFLNQDYVDYYDNDGEACTFSYTNGFYDYSSSYKYRIPYIDTMADEETYDLDFTIRATSIFGETYDLEYENGYISMWPGYGYPINAINLAPGLSTEAYTDIITAGTNTGTNVLLNDLLTMIYPASTDGTTYSFTQDNLPIYEAGTYTFIYEDIYGTQYTEEVTVAESEINLETTDSTAPSLTFVSSSLQDGETYGAATYYNSLGIGDGLNALYGSIGEKLGLMICDQSETKIILKATQGDVTYTSESDVIYGVTLEDDTLYVANAAYFYLYVVDEMDNVSETLLDFTAPFGDWVDNVAPSITAYLTALSADLETPAGETETIAGTAFESAVLNMSTAWGREIVLSISDYSPTKTIITAEVLAAPNYETATSEEITGVTLSGDSITVTASTAFYIYIIDELGNYTELYADMTTAVGELDEDNPEVTLGFKYLYAGSYVGDGTDGDYVTIELGDVANYLASLTKQAAYQLYVTVTDKSNTKTILSSTALDEVTYASTSETIEGVSLNGSIIEVTEPVSFYLYVVDGSNNYVSTEIDMTGLVAGSVAVAIAMPTILYETLQTGGTRAYLIIDDETVSCSNADGSAVPSTGSYTTAYYYHDFPSNGSFSFSLTNTWGTTRSVIVTINDIGDIEVGSSDVTWSLNNSGYTNTPITATVSASRYIVKAVLDCDSSVANVTFGGNLAYVEFSSSETVNLTLTDSGGSTSTTELTPTGTVDKTPPVITEVSKVISDDLDSYTLSYSSNEPVVFSQNDTPTSVYAQSDLVTSITANGTYELMFSDRAGNFTIETVIISDIDTLALSLSFNTTSSDTGSVTDTSLLNLSVGSSIYVKSNKDASFVDAYVSGGSSTNVTADTWTKVTQITEAPENYPMFTFTSTTTVDGKSKTWTSSTVFTEITLKDTQAPSLSLASKYLNATTGDAMETLLRNNATVTDNMDENPSLTLSVIPSTVGAHTVTYTATDASGNSSTATCYVTVSLQTDVTLTIDGTNLTAKGLYTLRNDGAMTVSLATDEPYAVYYLNGYYLASQMKIFGICLGYDLVGNQTFDTEVFGSGYTTVLIRMQDRTEYLYYIYRN